MSNTYTKVEEIKKFLLPCYLVASEPSKEYRKQVFAEPFIEEWAPYSDDMRYLLSNVVLEKMSKANVYCVGSVVFTFLDPYRDLHIFLLVDANGGIWVSYPYAKNIQFEDTDIRLPDGSKN